MEILEKLDKEGKLPSGRVDGKDAVIESKKGRRARRYSM